MTQSSNLPPELQDVKKIRVNQRYSTYNATLDDSPVFVKQVNQDGVSDNGILDELWGIMAFKQLSEAGDLPFDVPDIISVDNDVLITSFADGELLEFNNENDDFNEQIEFLAASLAKIDMLTLNANGDLKTKFGAGLNDSDSLITKFNKRLNKLPLSDHFDKDLISKSIDFAAINSTELRPRLTHADFTPNNIIANDNHKTLIDYESVSLLWPRFYDLVNLTLNRMTTDPSLVKGCQQIVEKYFLQNKAIDDPSLAISQMNIIAVYRCLSLINEYMTKPNKKHNVNEQMTTDLSRRISAILNGVLNNKPYFEVL